jgi:hypothetical protein
MENEKVLSDSEIESNLEEDIVFGKLFDFSRVFIVLTELLIMKMFDMVGGLSPPPPKKILFFFRQILPFTHIFLRDKNG